jgi:glycerophosphoryl diester phosphodiesterase
VTLRRYPQRIAHAYGNTRERLRTALESDIDAIEVDVWSRADQIWVRHERRLEPLPLLVDKRMRGHALPPFSLPLGKRLYVRLDINRLTLSEVLETVAGTKGLLIDLKGAYRGRENREFARTLVRTIRDHEADDWISVCGQFWPALEDVQKEAPELQVRYSVEKVYQWEKFMRMVRDDNLVRRVCIEHRFMNEERALFLKQRGVSVFCWTVDGREEARRLAAAGVDGIISNDLGILAELRTGAPVGNQMALVPFEQAPASAATVGDEMYGGGLEGGEDRSAG